MFNVSIVRGSSLGWNKSVELILSQSYVLIVGYYAPFGCSGQHSSWCFWQARTVRFMLSAACSIDTCNICLSFDVIFLWLLFSCCLADCHPFNTVSLVCHYVLKV